MKMPLMISLPHGGLQVPPEVKDICILSHEDLLTASDQEAREIYGGLLKQCQAFCHSDIARAIVDLNRAPDDLGPDGVIKTRTCWNVPVYRNFPDNRLIGSLLAGYYFPYHDGLRRGRANPAVRLGLDCHTMSAIGPPVGPDPGRERPLVCVSNGDGTCPGEWLTALAACLSDIFNEKVAINSPFRGGYITRYHAAEMPWIQIEISQTPKYSAAHKKNCLLEALRCFCHTVFQEEV